jgi:hypothetical protein
MGGYDIPRYAKEYLREWRRHDRLLRLRWSQDEPGRFILERKTKYLYPPDNFKRGSDRAIQLSDGYRRVFVFNPNEIHLVIATLRASDVHRLGARALGRELDAQDDREMAMIDRARIAEFEAIASDHYDRLAWEEKRRVVVA